MRTRLCVAEGHGPVDAFSQALAEARCARFPRVSISLQLIDFKVRVVNSADGTCSQGPGA